MWYSMSRRKSWAARGRIGIRPAARMAFQASSGNFASITTFGAPFGILIRQSGRLPFDSVAWNS